MTDSALDHGDARPAGGDHASFKVAIIGGGCAAMTAAFELSRPEHRRRYAITVYQPSFRLGGKGASGRGTADRIEAHGLHLWMGFYENAFRILRECYAELDAIRRRAGSRGGPTRSCPRRSSAPSHAGPTEASCRGSRSFRHRRGCPAIHPTPRVASPSSSISCAPSGWCAASSVPSRITGHPRARPMRAHGRSGCSFAAHRRRACRPRSSVGCTAWTEPLVAAIRAAAGRGADDDGDTARAPAESDSDAESHARVPYRTHVAGAPAANDGDGVRMRIVVASARPAEVAIDLHPGAATRPLIAHALRSASDERGGEVGLSARISGVAFEPADPGDASRAASTVRIEIPADRPAGMYHGVLIDPDSSLPAGTIRVRVHEAPAP